MNLSEMPRDVLRCIVEFLETLSLTRFSMVNRRMQALFGQEKMIMHFRIQVKAQIPGGLMSFAGKHGDVEIASYHILRHGTLFINDGMSHAIHYGHHRLVDFFISQGSCDWNFALIRSLESGNISMVKKFLLRVENGAFLALYSAARNEHVHLVEFLMTSIDTSSFAAPPFQLPCNAVLECCARFYFAVRHGNVADARHWFAHSGAQNFSTALLLAAKYGHYDMVQFVLSEGAPPSDQALAFARMGNHVNIVKLIETFQNK